MNIINKLTLRYLKQNKKRTIFTILSIALSVTMINAVGISLNSIMKYYKETIEITSGTYHYHFVSNNQEFFDIIKEDEKIKDYYFTNTEGYYDEKNKISVSLKKGDQTYFDKRNISEMLVQGNLPSSSDEIALNDRYLYLDYQIGDKLTLTRDDKDITFTIVGFIDPNHVVNSYNQYYDCISYSDITNGEFYTIWIEDKDFSKNLFEHADELYIQGSSMHEEAFYLSYNTAYLGVNGVYEDGSSSSFIAIYRLVIIILIIIIIASVFIIYQAFNLSTHDKIKYLGMLSSVGATPRQKRNSVFFEGLVLTLIALPIGYICSYIGMFVTFSYINTLEIVSERGATIPTTMSIEYMGLTIVLTLVTLFLSLVKPAIHLSRISVIDALRKNDEIKVKRSKLKVGFIQRKIYKYDHQLAIKNYKRQGNRSKVIVFSLALSMVLFVSIFSFSKNLYNTSVKDTGFGLYDLVVVADKKDIEDTTRLLNSNSKVDSFYYSTNYYEGKASLNTDYFAKSIYNDYNVDVYLTVLDENTFKKICEENKVAYKGSNQALISSMRLNIEGREKSYKIKDIQSDFFKTFEYVYGYENDREIKKQAPQLEHINYISTDDYRLFSNYVNAVELIVPMEYYNQIDINGGRSISFYVKTDLHQEVEDELMQQGYDVYNYTQSNESSFQMILVMQIFIYGFICLMILFTLINIVNMMSASIDKRQKEFAMLLSVGMSHKGLKKMIFYESLIYGIKTFIYGVPVCILIEWIMYKVVTDSFVPFEISNFAYLISFIVVMMVMLFTFKVGLNKLNRQNIIESLKDDI